jgi:hypothetical protein
MAWRLLICITLLVLLALPTRANELPKSGLGHRMSCVLVRYYVTKYTATAAEAWARSKGATEFEIEKARQCLKVYTAARQ